MPGTSAKRGDIYNVRATATFEGDAHVTPRRMVCVAELPMDQMVWKAMSRTTTAGADGDLVSPANAAVGLTKDGWWSLRFLRSVKKRWTGHPDECPYLATLTDPLLSEVMDHYRFRNRAA